MSALDTAHGLIAAYEDGDLDLVEWRHEMIEHARMVIAAHEALDEIKKREHGMASWGRKSALLGHATYHLAGLAEARTLLAEYLEGER
ncbi:hypothetical protein ACUY2L_06890 [Corynebacterium mastitidis]